MRIKDISDSDYQQHLDGECEDGCEFCREEEMLEKLKNKKKNESKRTDG